MRDAMQAAIAAAETLSMYPYEQLAIAACEELSRVVVHRSDDIAEGLDYTGNKHKVGLLLAARDLVNMVNRIGQELSSYGETETEKTGQDEVQTHYGSETGKAGNFEQAVSADETGEGAAAET